MEKNKTGPLVTVDAEKLKWGLRSAFVGMALVVESIQLETDGTAKPSDGPGHSLNPRHDPVADTSGANAAAVAERNATIANIPDLKVPKSDEASSRVQEGNVEPESAAADTAETDSNKQTAAPDASPSEPEADVPILSKDDLITVITQKIKQNAANQKKIGALVNSYGATTLSDLSPDRYEAFMTDLAQI